jgi:hypothetical protein
LNASKPDYWFEGLKAASDGGEISRDLVCTAFCRLWLASVLSGTFVSAQDTATWLMHDLGASSVFSFAHGERWLRAILSVHATGRCQY